MFAMSNEEYLLAASPNVRPGGGGNPPGSIRRMAHFAGYFFVLDVQ